MKALLRVGTGLLGLLLTASVSFGYVLVSPVFKQPYPQAPDFFNTTGYYLIDGWGRLTGPYYNVRPPCQPFGGMLPGKTGQAIMSGNVPHTLLLSKEGLAIGTVPLVGQKMAKGTPEQGSSHPGAGLPEMGGPPGAYMIAGGPSTLGPMHAPNPNLQIPYGQVPNMQIPSGPTPYPMPNPTMQIPSGRMPYPMPNPNMQVPYTQLPYPYGAVPYRPVSMPYPMPYGMPNGGGAMPYPMPMPMQPSMPMAYYPVSNGNFARYYDPRTGIAQAQNMTPLQPFMPIPGFGAPGAPMPPNMPTPPGMDMQGRNGFEYLGPMQQAEPLGPLYRLEPLQRMQPPMPQMEPMQLPRMDYAPPPQQKVGGNAYPTHPFVRSPRDFFMWGENMEDEERARRRPFPVP